MLECELDIGVLGALSIRVNGETVELPGVRQRSALAALLIRRGSPVSTDALIEATWGNDLPVNPLSSLYTVISRLRAALGRGHLRTAPGGYILSLPQGSVDSERFESLRALAAARPGAEAALLLDSALQLWHGAAYMEFNDQDFVRAEAARLEELRLATVEDRAAIDLALGLCAGVIESLGPLVKRFPFRERALGSLMTALYRTGRTPEALEIYQRYRRTLADELGLDPSPYLSRLQSRVLGNDGTEDAQPRRLRSAHGSLGAMRDQTTFIGRKRETANLLGLVTEHRLVCVAGPGGVGKTRLVAEALDLLERQTGRAAVVVNLADVERVVDEPGRNAAPRRRPGNARAKSARPDPVGTAIAAALGLEPTVDMSFSVLTDFLRAGHYLLVLDNCEHHRRSVSSLGAALARDYPDARVLVTSRVRLGSPDEQILTVAPLEVPMPQSGRQESTAADAVRLFLDRILAVRSDFHLTDDSLADVVSLCRRLDGLPLALELAARRAATLGLRPLLNRLGEGLDLVAGSGPVHQYSLREVLHWSWELLGPRQQHLMESLSVFRGDFDLDAVEAVCGTETVRADLDLAEGIESSLVTMHEDESGTYYRLLETVRAYAAERLAASGRSEQVLQLHAEWATTVTAQYADALAGKGTMPGYPRLNRIRTDLIAAVRWSLRSEHPEIGGAISGNLALVPHWRPGAELWELTMGVVDSPGLRECRAASLALSAAAMAATERGQLEHGRRLAAEAQGLAADANERYLAGITLGIAALYSGCYPQAANHWRQLLDDGGLSDGHRADLHASLALLHSYAGNRKEARAAAAAARAAADLRCPSAIRAFVTYATGEVFMVDDLGSAPAVLREAALEGERLGADQVALVARIALFSALNRLGEYRPALEMAHSLLEGQLQTANWPQLWTTLRALAEALVETGYPAQAEFLLSAASSAASAPRLAGPDADRHERLRRRIQVQLGEQPAARIAALAGSLPRAEVVKRAWMALESNLTGRA